MEIQGDPGAFYNDSCTFTTIWNLLFSDPSPGDQIVAMRLLRRMGMETRMETIDHKKKRLKGIFFNFHTNCQWDGDPSVFNLVIILRSTHFYQYIKHTKVFAGTIKVSKSRREKRNTGVQSIPFFRVKSRFEDVYVPFDKLLQPNQLGGCRLPHPLSDLPWWQSLHQDDQGEVWWVVVYSFSKRFRWWWKVI